MSFLNETVLALAGAELVVYDHDGEVFFQVSLPEGLVDLSKYASFIPDGMNVRLSLCRHAAPRRAFGAIAKRPLVSGADPDFTPSVLSAEELRMRKLLNDVEKKTSENSKLLKRLEADRAGVRPDDVSDPHVEAEDELTDDADAPEGQALSKEPEE